MRKLLLAIIGSAIVGGPTSAMTFTAPSLMPWGSFSVDPALMRGHGLIKVEVAKVGRDLWVAEKLSKSRTGPDTLAWADSRTCDALIPTLAKLADLEPIKLTPPGVPPMGQNIIMDGANYEINAQGVYQSERALGEVRLTGNVNSPIAKWVDGALDALKPCWQTDPPKLGG